MNSILRQHNVRYPEISRYLRSYDPGSAITPQEWAKEECANFETGMLIFFLEEAVPPTATFNKKESEVNKAFKAKDLSIVVSRENNRAMAVNINVSDYELRFLEVLLLESARKAVLERRGFFYVMAKSSAPLTPSTISEVGRLGNMYAAGGSRRGAAVDNSSQTEPATALLAALGVRLIQPGGRQVLDLGNIFYMLFSASGQAEDRNRALLQAAFTPVVNDEASVVTEPVLTADSTPDLEPISKEENLFDLLTEQEKTSQALVIDQPEESESVAQESAGHTYRHLADTLSGLMSASTEEKSLLNKPANTNIPAITFPNPVTPPPSTDIVVPTSTPASAAPTNELPASGVDLAAVLGRRESLFNRSLETSDVNGLPALPPSEDATLNNAEPSAALSPLLESLKPENEPSVLSEKTEDRQSQEEFVFEAPQASEIPKPAAMPVTPVASTVPATAEVPAPAPETSTMQLSSLEEGSLNKMEQGATSLSSKLEQQVTKAAKKLAANAEESKRKLNLEVESLSKEILQDDKDTQASTLIQCDLLIKAIEQLSEDLRLKIADAAHTAREAIQLLQGSEQGQIEGISSSVRDSLLAICSNLQTKTQALRQTNREQLHAAVSAKLSEFKELIENKTSQIKKVGDAEQNKLEEKDSQFKEQISEEEETLFKTLERNVRSMNEEVENSWRKAENKINFSLNDFEQTIGQIVTEAELAISQLISALLVEQFLPKLKERQEIVMDMTAEMLKAFEEQSLSQRASQLSDLQASLTSACQQLKVSCEEGLGKIETAGKEQQSGLEETFKEADGYMVRNTAETLVMIDKSEQQVAEIESSAKKLAEMSSLDADPYLSEERNAAHGRVQSIKTQVESELERTLTAASEELTEVGQECENQLNNRRLEEIKSVTKASEDGLNQVKDALQEAFSAVQALREKYME